MMRRPLPAGPDSGNRGPELTRAWARYRWACLLVVFPAPAEYPALLRNVAFSSQPHEFVAAARLSSPIAVMLVRTGARGGRVAMSQRQTRRIGRQEADAARSPHRRAAPITGNDRYGMPRGASMRRRSTGRGPTKLTRPLQHERTPSDRTQALVLEPPIPTRMAPTASTAFSAETRNIHARVLINDTSDRVKGPHLSVRVNQSNSASSCRRTAVVRRSARFAMGFLVHWYLNILVFWYFNNPVP